MKTLGANQSSSSCGRRRWRSTGRNTARRPSRMSGLAIKAPLQALGGARPDRAVPVRRLAAEKVPHVEAPVHVVRGLVLLQVVRDEQVQVTVLLHNLRQRNLVERYRLPAPQGDVLPLGRVPVSERPRPGARVDGPAGADGRRGLRVGPGEAQALPRQGVEVGRPDPVVPVSPYVVLAQGVNDDQDDVLPLPAAGPPLGGPLHALLRAARAGAEHGHAGRAGPGRLQKISSGELTPQSLLPLVVLENLATHARISEGAPRKGPEDEAGHPYAKAAGYSTEPRAPRCVTWSS